MTTTKSENTLEKILRWIKETLYMGPVTRARVFDSLFDDIKQVNSPVWVLLDRFRGIPVSYLNQFIENDDVFICWSTLILANNYLLTRPGDGERTYELDVIKLNKLDYTGEINTELKKLKRRFVKSIHLLMEIQKNDRVFTRVVVFVLGVMRGLCIRFINILDLLDIPTGVDVSFLVPFVRGMPHQNFISLSKAVSTGIVSVEAFKNKLIACSLLKSKQFVCPMWNIGDGIESWVNPTHCSGSRFRYDTPLELLDLMYSSIKSALEGISRQSKDENMHAAADTNSKCIPLYLFSRLELGYRGTHVISYWKLPPDSAASILNTSTTSLLNIQCDESKTTLFTGFLFLLLKENKEAEVPHYVFIRTLKMAIRADHRESLCRYTERALRTIFETCKKRDLLNVRDVKMLAVFTLKWYCFHVLDAIIDLYPWIAKTWVDGEGNTLLGLAVSVRLTDCNFIERLLKKAPVLDSVDMLSRDSLLTPVMIHAGLKYSSLLPHQDYSWLTVLDLLYVHGAKIDCVNENGEGLLHRAACSNNFDLLVLLANFPSSTGKSFRDALRNVINVRRKLDGSTPIMISLARSHTLFSSYFIHFFKPKLNILMGKSEGLRVSEYLFLSCKDEELNVLGKYHYNMDVMVFKNAKKNNADYDLWREQFLCGGLGLLVEGEDNITEIGPLSSTGKLESPRLNARSYIFPRLLPSNRPQWLGDLFEDHTNILSSSPLERVKIYNEDDTECPVCKTEFREKPVATSCGHRFCRDCLSLLCVRNTLKCALCNTPNISVVTQGLIEAESRNCTVAHVTQRHWKLLSQNRYAFFVNDRWIDEKDL